jgi:hypothetical protein
MSALLQRLQAQAQQAETLVNDMTTVQTAPSVDPIPAGMHPMQFVKYIEYGKHLQTVKGVPDESKPARLEFKATFAVWCDGFDKPARYIDTGYFRVAISNNDKAKSFKMFKSMNHMKDCRTFPALLGRTFMGKVEQSSVPGLNGAAPKVYSNLVLDGFSALVDPITKKPYEVPALPDNAWGMFLWNAPTLEDWNALYIEGTTDDGKSKNFIQDTILSAVDYHGSALAALLGSGTVPSLTVPSSPTAEAPTTGEWIEE